MNGKIKKHPKNRVLFVPKNKIRIITCANVVRIRRLKPLTKPFEYLAS